MGVHRTPHYGWNIQITSIFQLRKTALEKSENQIYIRRNRMEYTIFTSVNTDQNRIFEQKERQEREWNLVDGNYTITVSQIRTFHFDFLVFLVASIAP